MKLFVAFAFLSLVTPAFAETFLTESDSGLIIGRDDCLIQTVDKIETKFSRDDFDYLIAQVEMTYTCVRHNGSHAKFSATDSVFFPGPTFDWDTQAWWIDQTQVARLDQVGRVKTDPNVIVKVRHDVHESHIGFNVEFYNP